MMRVNSGPTPVSGGAESEQLRVIEIGRQILN